MVKYIYVYDRSMSVGAPRWQVYIDIYSAYSTLAPPVPIEAVRAVSYRRMPRTVRPFLP